LELAIETFGLTKRFKYEPFGPGQMWETMWVDGIKKLFQAKKKGMAGQYITALDHATFNVRKGEFFGIVGPNGAGKSTLIKLLSGMFLPDEGTASVNGYDLLRDRYHVRASVSLVGSSSWRALDWALSVKDNLEFVAAVYGLPKEKARQRTEEALKTVGLWDKKNVSPSTLSSGMRQKLALAKGFLFLTPLFLLDEPTVGLDPPSAIAVRSFIKDELNRKLGQTVIITTHYMDEVDLLCERIVFLDKGRIVACDTPENLKNKIRGEDVSELEVVDFTSIMKEGIEKLDQVKGVTISTLDPVIGKTIVRVRSKESGDVLPDLLRIIQENGGIVQYVRDDKPSLDDVFLHITGQGRPKG